MERLNLGSSEGFSTKLEDGTFISARKAETKKSNPGEVAMHEAAHVVAAGNIVYATIIPTGEALGVTQPVKMTAAAAAAPDALGYSGTGWDIHVVENYLGVSKETARAAAKSVLSGKDQEMKEVATILQEKKTITQADVVEARENVQNNNLGIYPVEIEITNLESKTVKLTRQSFRHEVKIADLISR